MTKVLDDYQIQNQGPPPFLPKLVSRHRDTGSICFMSRDNLLFME
jgi:hypothetical protein